MIKRFYLYIHVDAKLIPVGARHVALVESRKPNNSDQARKKEGATTSTHRVAGTSGDDGEDGAIGEGVGDAVSHDVYWSGPDDG